MKLLLLSVSLFLVSTIYSQTTGTFVDKRDGKTYKWVKVGEQTWMAQNLDYDSKGSSCYANNKSNCSKYGHIYDAGADTSMCPAGWHIPSYAEWEQLAKFIARQHAECIKVDKYAWKNMGKYLKSKAGWKDSVGNDEYGLNFQPCGYSEGGGYFGGIDTVGYFWSTDGTTVGVSFYRVGDKDNFFALEGWEGGEFYIRCIKNK